MILQAVRNHVEVCFAFPDFFFALFLTDGVASPSAAAEVRVPDERVDTILLVLVCGLLWTEAVFVAIVAHCI